MKKNKNKKNKQNVIHDIIAPPKMISSLRFSNISELGQSRQTAKKKDPTAARVVTTVDWPGNKSSMNVNPKSVAECPW